MTTQAHLLSFTKLYYILTKCSYILHFFRRNANYSILRHKFAYYFSLEAYSFILKHIHLLRHYYRLCQVTTDKIGRYSRKKPRQRASLQFPCNKKKPNGKCFENYRTGIKVDGMRVLC